MTDAQNWQLLGALALLVIISWCIARVVRNHHKPETADTVRDRQLLDAKTQALEWRAQAERAAAMADMYDRRTERLS